MHPSNKPTKADLLASADRTISQSAIGADLRVLFVGINPGLYSGWDGDITLRDPATAFGRRSTCWIYAAAFSSVRGA